jgi:penicillin-binding protein 1A
MTDEVKKYLKYFWFTWIGGFIFFIFLLLLIDLGVFGKMPDWEELENPKAALAAQVISEDGEVLGRYFLEENRTNAELNELHPIVVNALIATEDVRFADHSGIDVRGLIRAVFSFGHDGGASTLTQQLAKNLFKRSHSKWLIIFDKLKEWIIAVKLERKYTKTEILNLYLNVVSFSDNAYGIKTAAQTFFDKPIDSLKVEEAAVLIGMLKSPAQYNPRTHPERAKFRRNTVLQQMVKYNYLKEEEYQKIKEKPIQLQYSYSTHNEGLAPYFREYLRLDLQKWIKDNPKPDGSYYDIYKEGLKVYTTINSKMQRYAEEAAYKHLAEMQKLFFAQFRGKDPFEARPQEFALALHGCDRYRLLKNAGKTEEEIKYEMQRHIRMKVFTYAGERDTIMSPWDSIVYHRMFLQCGFMVMDPSNGHVKAWVGGINHKYFQLDHVNINTKRQIGSTFKPFVYTVAIDNGWSPCQMVPNEQVVFTSYNNWTPKNSDNKYGGSQSLMTGLAHSTNCITAYLMKQIGPRPVVDMAHKMGITSKIDPFPSICLGTPDISVFEMVGAYSTFANKGFASKPIYITRIEDKYGNVIKEFVDQQTEVISEQTAYVMNKMLQGVVTRGTAQRLRSMGLDNEIAGKTGTTQGNTDAYLGRM